MCFDSGPLKLFDYVLRAVPTMSESNNLNVYHFTKPVGSRRLCSNGSSEISLDLIGFLFVIVLNGLLVVLHITLISSLICTQNTLHLSIYIRKGPKVCIKCI